MYVARGKHPDGNVYLLEKGGKWVLEGGNEVLPYHVYTESVWSNGWKHIINHTSDLVSFHTKDYGVLYFQTVSPLVSYFPSYLQEGSIGIVDVKRRVHGKSIGLPESLEDTYYIVPESVALAFKERKDFLYVSHYVKDTKWGYNAFISFSGLWY